MMIAAITLTLAIAQTGAASKPNVEMISSAKLKADFNAAKNRVRLLFIWAPS